MLLKNFWRRNLLLNSACSLVARDRGRPAAVHAAPQKLAAHAARELDRPTVHDGVLAARVAREFGLQMVLSSPQMASKAGKLPEHGKSSSRA